MKSESSATELSGMQRNGDAPLLESECADLEFFGSIKEDLVRVLEEEVNELQQALTNKQEQEHAMLQVFFPYALPKSVLSGTTSLEPADVNDFFFVLPPCFPSTAEEEVRRRKVANRKAPDMTSHWKWYTVFRGWDPGVYGTWYECYKQGINFDGFHYAHFDTKEEAIAGFDRYNHAATIEREVHDQLTLEEGLAELGEIPPPPLPPRMWIEELYEAKGVPLPRSPPIDEEPRIDLFPRDRTLYQRVGSGYEPVMEPWWSD
ncbi:hypothetical protein Syun_022547 [Stephania yunnanensis]|uniref:Ribonuclease H1 N-terminal domain-containing protein n=1 Tax=Stephania yunnanensis TaxID=152371 RepID=A0AAP0F772_9MAGN